MPRHLGHIGLWLLLVVGLAGCKPGASDSSGQPGVAPEVLTDRFLSLMNAGKNHLDQGDATNALAIYTQAAALVPNHPDVRLNLAVCHLLSGAATQAIAEADEALKLEPNSAAAYFIKGSAWLRLARPEEAVKALENAQRIEAGQTATLFQLGLARMGLEQWEAAIAAFREGIRIEPNRLHGPAHYLMAQALRRLGRDQEAQQELLLHQSALETERPLLGMAVFERCKYTRARVPFKLDQPNRDGITVRFVDATARVLGEEARRFAGPLALLDVNHAGWQSLFVVEPGQGFRLLLNSGGILRPAGPVYPVRLDTRPAQMLVGDLQNDRFEDVIVLGPNGSQVFVFGTNGVATNASAASGLEPLRATHGLLMDLDFTGKLDLVAVAENPSAVQVFRQAGPLAFTNLTSTSGVPASLVNARAVLMEDWNVDGVMDVIVSRAEGPPLLLEKQRGGRLLPREPTNWVAGAVSCTGDFNNDLRPDLAVAGAQSIVIIFNDGRRRAIAFPDAAGVRQLVAVDYDNDGWLDLWAVGATIRAWRNVGLAGFSDQTTQIGLDQFRAGAVSEIHFADFDLDCDSDAVVALADGGLRYLSNEGGDRNAQVKVRLGGTRSNASGIGCKVEIAAGGLRLVRTVQRLPIEIGVGRHQKLDSFLVQWFNWPQGSAEVPFHCREPLVGLELSMQEGSCPYLYAWNGERFRFVTDILGGAPLGLPIAEGRYTEADPEEFVWIGDDQTFRPRNGKYQLQITEELREVLYLDEAKLVVADHEPGTEVHPTDKLLPSGPFPPGALLTLHHEHLLQRAETLDGRDVTAALQAVDGRRVSPPRLRVPQLRGLAEPHGVVLDFGPLDPRRPLVLVLNGWLRFGGGMANIAASHDPSLPFPFPVLDAELEPGHWQRVDVVVGAPAGKTKTILVDLDGKLAPGTRRLRLTEAFELHWDRIALLEKKPDARTTVTFLAPAEAHLHFRGFSRLKDLPWDWPLPPDYDALSPNSPWTIIPGGWCTRYGDVLELLTARDEGLVLINSGDELSLSFAANALPPKPAAGIRDFFLYADGWDKDSDFHVAAGTRVEPLPFHGMDDQHYGRQPRPSFPSDALHRRYNTRWVEGRVLNPRTEVEGDRARADRRFSLSPRKT